MRDTLDYHRAIKEALSGYLTARGYDHYEPQRDYALIVRMLKEEDEWYAWSPEAVMTVARQMGVHP